MLAVVAWNMSEKPAFMALMRSSYGDAVVLLATFLIEILIALIFGYRSRRELKIILITNAVTQVLLNSVMSVLDYTSGGLVWLFILPLLEIAVFIVEAIVYAISLKTPEKGRARAVFYALAANLTSAAAGVVLGLLVSAM